MTNYLRPDEHAAYSEIERAQKRDKNLGSAIKAGVGIASSATAASLASKAAPFLSKYIPADLAVKGLSKISPNLGKFFDQGKKMGLNLEDGINFVKESFLNSENKETPKQKRNIIQQYSDQLHEFLNEEIKKGRSPIQAGAIAQNDKKFKDVINKISKDHKIPWSNILESVYGSENQSSIQSQEQQQQTQSQGIDPRVAQILAEGNEILKSLRGNRG